MERVGRYLSRPLPARTPGQFEWRVAGGVVG